MAVAEKFLIVEIISRLSHLCLGLTQHLSSSTTWHSLLYTVEHLSTSTSYTVTQSHWSVSQHHGKTSFISFTLFIVRDDLGLFRVESVEILFPQDSSQFYLFTLKQEGWGCGLWCLLAKQSSIRTKMKEEMMGDIGNMATNTRHSVGVTGPACFTILETCWAGWLAGRSLDWLSERWEVWGEDWEVWGVNCEV